jgi:predicted DCC family thiol-disulfide oxidoreductase YuxK
MSMSSRVTTTIAGPPQSPAAAPPDHPIIFFDGVCAMCDRFVSLIARVDRKRVFRFAPLQGETARRLLPPLGDDPQRWSMLYLDERGLHDQSEASLQVYRRLGGWAWPLSLLRFVPRLLRDPVYRVVARNRYRWFGRRDACRVPTPAEREQFLP